MTPREKANDLVNRYYYMLPNNGLIDTGINSCDSRYKEAIKCAFVAVEEIINTLNYDIRDLDVRGNILLDLIEHWREIHTCIQKIKDKEPGARWTLEDIIASKQKDISSNLNDIII
tara:strand:+ start:1898 stop:2245 length:348 start_codon:yes stop_codon:yes gene_type:complete